MKGTEDPPRVTTSPPRLSRIHAARKQLASQFAEIPAMSATAILVGPPLTRGAASLPASGIFGRHKELLAFTKLLDDNCPEQFNTTIVGQSTPGEFYCEVSQGHVDKWHGINKLASHLSLSPENICTVGDEMNDLPMITAVPHGVAMGNGHPVLREQASFVCGNNTEDGLLDVVRYINKHNAAPR